MKNVKTILVSVILIVMVVVLFAFGLSPLFKKLSSQTVENIGGASLTKGSYVEGVVYYASDEVLEVSNSLNFLIPMGKEHFFLIFNDDFSRCVAVRADKNWSAQFGEEGFNVDGVPIGGVVKDLDYDQQREMNEVVQTLQGYGITITAATYYIDLLAYRYAIFTLIALVILVLLIIGGILIVKKGIQHSILAKIYCILIMLECCFCLHILAILG